MVSGERLQEDRRPEAEMPPIGNLHFLLAPALLSRALFASACCAEWLFFARRVTQPRLACHQNVVCQWTSCIDFMYRAVRASNDALPRDSGRVEVKHGRTLAFQRSATGAYQPATSSQYLHDNILLLDQTSMQRTVLLPT